MFRLDPRRRGRPADPRPARGAQRHSGGGLGRARSRLARCALGDARLLVVTGDGGAFCAGADLADFAAMRGDERRSRASATTMRAALDALRDLADPDASPLIEGACYGAGVALAMACDLRIAAAGARFAITPAKIGISYPQEDVHRLVALVGPGQAARLLFTAASHRRRRGGADRPGRAVRCRRRPDCRGDPRQRSRQPRRAQARRSRLAAEGWRSDAEQDRALRRADRRRRAGAPARSAAAEMIGGRHARFRLPPFCCSPPAAGEPETDRPTAPPRRRPASPTTGSNAGPARREPFERTCSVESVDSDDGRLLTVRKPDGGFRRLLRRPATAAASSPPTAPSRRDGRSCRDGRIEVAIGGDRFRLPATVRGR